MKLYKSLLYFAAALTTAGTFAGCSEEATLDGANAVYLELQPTDIYLRLGDTVKINARVTNEAGDVIPTHVALAVDDETVAKILGDTAVVAVNGGQEKSTKLRASLVNGQYAVTNVNVVKNTPAGIHAVNDMMEVIESMNSWKITHATATFAVEPRELLDDYSVGNGIEVTLEGLEPYTEETDGELITIDRKKGLITVHFSSPAVAGTGKVILKVGEGGTAQECTLPVLMQPSFQSVTFYGKTAGPDISSMPYLDGRPKLGLLSMYWALNCEKTLDINSSDEVRVAMNIFGGNMDDIMEAVKCYKWNVVSGGSLLKVKDEYEIVEYNGFDAIIGVRSGVQTGDMVFECETPCIRVEDEEPAPISLTLTYHVVDIKKTYPITEITVSNDNIEMDMNATEIVTVGVIPAASWMYQKAAVVVADPDIVSVGEYEGMELPIRSLKPGTTTITLSGYNDSQLVTKVIKVTVKDPIGRIEIEGTPNIFVGAETRYKGTAYSMSGALMDVPFEWVSSNTSVATVNSEGVVEGVAEGTTSITAKNDEIVSGARSLRVVAAPAAITSPDDFQGFYEDENTGTDIVFLDANEGMLIIPNGYADGKFEGTYNLSGAYYILNDAQAPATGTVTITKGSDQDEYIVTMNVTIALSANHTVTFRFTSGSVYYLPA